MQPPDGGCHYLFPAESWNWPLASLNGLRPVILAFGQSKLASDQSQLASGQSKLVAGQSNLGCNQSKLDFTQLFLTTTN